MYQFTEANRSAINIISVALIRIYSQTISQVSSSKISLTIMRKI